MTSDRRPTSRTFLIPSIPDLVFVGLACLQVAAAPMILLNRDGDLPRHIAVGKVMLDSGGLMGADFFSHTAYGQPFLAYEWLSQLIFAAVYQFAGLDAVAVLAAVTRALPEQLPFTILNGTGKKSSKNTSDASGSPSDASRRSCRY